ncbi:D-alanine--D-alanine ligase [Streptomyces sp. NPDC059278]|uniref:D-alanine--D-alanine ligase family protein n=1 Tax=Streptomyces sp. NPDC059278 TaxID=3346801 RepID=UPI00367A17F4
MDLAERFGIIDPKTYRCVAVITGGCSQERDRSLLTFMTVAKALAMLGVKAKKVDLKDHAGLVGELEGCDAAMLAIAGRGAEDGALQGLLETLGIPYTGSGVLASSVGMDKLAAKRLVHGRVHTAFDQHIDRSAPIDDQVHTIERQHSYPVIVKPVSEGGSIGLAFAKDQKELTAALTAADETTQLMVERYVEGVSVSVGVLEDEHGLVALTPLETHTDDGLYSYEAKRSPGATTYHCPARLSQRALDRLRQDAIDAHRALGCSGYSRHDFIVTPEESTVWLEVNTLPGLSTEGNLARMAAADGISYERLVSHILRGASLKGGRPDMSGGQAA